MKLLLIKLLVAAILPIMTISMFITDKNKVKNNIKVTVCHIPPGNPDNMHEITISINALQTHLDHGDLICSPEE